LAAPNALLQVDLDAGESRIEEIAAEVEDRFVGGRGLGAYLVSFLPPEILPLQPTAGVALCIGPLAGLGIPGTARVTLSAKSPLTGTILDSNSGSAIAAILAAQGLRAIFLTGKAREPSYLLIKEGRAEVLSARELWGKPTAAAFEWLKKHHPSAAAMAIGPAGETGVLFANVICGDYGAFGRGGLGAVLGSKNIKALVFNPPYGYASSARTARDWKARIRELPLIKHGLTKYGTVPLLKLMAQLGMLYSSTHAERLRLSQEADSIETVAYGCGGCTVLCKRRSRKNNAPVKYQSLWALGAQNRELSIDMAQQAAALCDELGMDAVSAGSTLGCAKLLAERGLLDEEMREAVGMGLPVALEKIACREGPWRRLGEGSSRLAAACGDEGAASVVKGMELPGFDPRGVPELALSYATSNRGACHTRGVAPLDAIKDSFSTLDPRMVVGRVIEGQDWEAAMDTLMLCRFVAEGLGKEEAASLCSAGLGRAVGVEKLSLLGARVWNLERCYNLAAGIDPSQDSLPDALLTDPRHKAELRELLRNYYELRGWSPEGRPEPALLERLDLSNWTGVCEGPPSRQGAE